MEAFPIPDRLEPVTPSAPTRRQGFSSDDRRKRNHHPPSLPIQDDDNDAPVDGEDLHNVDELA
jgi:hypothetical protein